jgi:hypothetical protein
MYVGSFVDPYISPVPILCLTWQSSDIALFGHYDSPPSSSKLEERAGCWEGFSFDFFD